MSADGAIMYAQPRLTAGMWKSTDGGATFAPLAGVSFQGGNSAGGTFAGMAVSANGARVLAGGGADGAVYLTTDGGANWAPIPIFANFMFYANISFPCVAMSPSGQVMIALSNMEENGRFLRSGDGGATWVEMMNGYPNPYGGPLKEWASGGACAAVSADGQVLHAVNAGANTVIRSVNSGKLLQTHGGAVGSGALTSVAASADGAFVFAGQSGPSGRLQRFGMAPSPTQTPTASASPSPPARSTRSPAGCSTRCSPAPP
jgi:photosystem II stability/assembly factor-like uncharacterized protein